MNTEQSQAIRELTWQYAQGHLTEAELMQRIRELTLNSAHEGRRHE